VESYIKGLQMMVKKKTGNKRKAVPEELTSEEEFNCFNSDSI
jgi:hypothetical protein